MKQNCPKCNHKSLRYRSMSEDYICDHTSCEAIFNENLEEMHVSGKRVIKDKKGNYYKVEIEKEPGIMRHIKTYFLEPNKTTLRGEYKKLRNDSECKYPERLSCNYGTGFDRCEFMKYEEYWRCKYDKKVEAMKQDLLKNLKNK